ncbi:MAG: poly-beta-1,6 N-acetyl-D-glucosamine export porin PgaA [Gammaproteobacteria bacterium]
MAAEPEPKADYQRAINLAHQGHHDRALSILAGLVDEDPGNERYLYDYITVLGWAERDNEVLNYVEQLDFETLPVYVLETVGKSARNLEQYPLAIDVYRLSLKKMPGRDQSIIGLSWAYIGNKQANEAKELLQDHVGDLDDSVEVWEPLASSLLESGAVFEALKIFDRILLIDPGNLNAYRGRALAAARIGAPHQALDIVDEEDIFLDEKTMFSLKADRAAATIRWGALWQGLNHSFEETDSAIQQLQDLLNDTVSGAIHSAGQVQRIRYDLLVALRDRQRWTEVVDLYSSMTEVGDEIPRYVLVAVADTYLKIRQPEKARDLYLAALEEQPDDFSTQISLFYAYIECEEYDAAIKLIDQVVQSQAPWVKEYDGSLKANYSKSSSATIAAMARAYADEHQKAQIRLEQLAAKAPHNADIRSALATVYLWRGWPQRAEMEFNIASTADPQHFDAKMGRFSALLDLMDYRNAENQLDRLEVQNPDAIKQAVRRWNIHNMREIYIEASRSSSSGIQFGSRDEVLDAYLYSRPLDSKYRAFFHHHLAQARFPEGDALFRRNGAGVEYRNRRYLLTGELSTGVANSDDPGMTIRGNWNLDDYWRVGASFNSVSNEVPLRGRLNEKVEGWSAGVSLNYRFHESRELGMAVNRLDLSDGNLRNSFSTTVFQRLKTGPKYKLDGRVGLYAANNNLPNASYFNPKNDLSMEFVLTNEWLVYRRYSQSFRHKLIAGLGAYQQSGFGNNGTWLTQYEHQWNTHERFELRYGLGRIKHVYDGLGEFENRLYFSMDWRF